MSTVFQEIILPTTQRSSICWYVYIFCMFVMSTVFQEIILPTTQRSSICWYVYIFCMFVMSTVFQVINSSYNTKIFNMLVCIHLLYVCNVYSISGNHSSHNTKIFNMFNMLVCIHLLYVCNVYSISGNQFFLQHKDLQYAGMYTSSVCL